MLTKEEVLERHRLIRNYTTKRTGIEIVNLEKHIREIAISHIELLEKFEETRKKSINTIGVLTAELEKLEKSYSLIGTVIEKIAKT